MVTLRMIANAGRKSGPITRLADTLEHMRSIPGRLWRAASGALSVVAFCALFGVATSAQQNPQPQSEPAPPAAAAPSTPPASVSASAASWQQSLVARLSRLHPPLARGVEGVVSLAFSIDRHGNVVSSRIVRSSGSAVLDAEALDLLKRVAPLPPPPAEIANSELSFVVPIRFVAGSKR
jgi:TonB family protein